MIISMAAFASADAMVKLATSATSVGLAMMVMGGGGGLIFLLICLRSGTRVVSPIFLHPVIILRNITEAAAAFFIFQAFASSPLSTVAAVMQAIPLILTICAAAFLGERVGPRRWLAVAIGFVGVMIIIQPGGEQITWTDLYAVFGTICLAFRDLASRLAPKEATTPLLSFYAFMTLLPLGTLLNVLEGGVWVPSSNILGVMALMIVLAVLGYYCVTAAMRIGEVSSVSPLRYTRLPFAALIGYWIFADVPDLATVIGSVLVVGSGLFVMLREAQLSRQTDS